MTIDEIQAELQEEIDLCNKYFIEEDMHKESTEHERLALKIVTMCMQTLSALKDGELEDYKHIKQWKSDVKEVAKEYNCGWIPCSEKLPDGDKKEYIVQKTSGFIDILGFTKDAYKLDRYDFSEYKDKKKQLFYDYDSEYGYTEWECEAWQPLPERFKESDEE